MPKHGSIILYVHGNQKVDFVPALAVIKLNSLLRIVNQLLLGFCVVVVALLFFL